MVTCEIHEGAACFKGGEFGNTWTCPACEIERLRSVIEKLSHEVGALEDFQAKTEGA
jgi:hypothetical protein